jgi:hypothetical protein
MGFPPSLLNQLSRRGVGLVVLARSPDPRPSRSRVRGPRGRPCYQPEVDHWVYGKPWPDDANNDGVVDE